MLASVKQVVGIYTDYGRHLANTIKQIKQKSFRSFQKLNIILVFGPVTAKWALCFSALYGDEIVNYSENITKPLTTNWSSSFNVFDILRSLAMQSRYLRVLAIWY